MRSSPSARAPRHACIWAQDRDGVIGDGKQMLWHVPADYRFFRAQTLGCPVVMGRASFEALGVPLSGRTNIVLSRQPGYRADGAEVRTSLSDAFVLADQVARETGAETVWVAGGGQVYRQAMESVDRLVVTELDLRVSAAVPGLVRAPEIDPQIWDMDPDLSDSTWREKSGDARWRVRFYERI